ncbi:MAG: hypothetical protein HYT94_02460 [Parcubacteria group bacterium]|nr:hypothetical protein [Parcubacteria group bacterium]
MNHTAPSAVLGALAKVWIGILFAASFFSFFLVSTVVFAQESESIKIQPTLIEENIESGKSFSSVLHVTNLGTASQSYKVTVQDIESIDESGHPVFAKEHEATGFELSSWVKIPRPELTLAPGQSADVPFTITAPENAAPGGHFGSIFLSTQGEKPKTVGASVGYQVGAILSFRVAGETREEARIRSFTSEKMIYGESKAVFRVKVENLGNTLVRPRGLLEIVDMFGKKTVTLDLNESEAAILPHAVREFTVEWNDDRVRMGKYQAIASMEYGTDVKHTIFQELSFWIVPSKVVLPVIGVVFLVALILYFWVKLYIRRKMREYGMPKGSKAAPKGELSSKSAWVTIAFIGFLVVFLLVVFAIFA